MAQADLEAVLSSTARATATDMQSDDTTTSSPASTSSATQKDLPPDPPSYPEEELAVSPPVTNGQVVHNTPELPSHNDQVPETQPAPTIEVEDLQETPEEPSTPTATAASRPFSLEQNGRIAVPEPEIVPEALAAPEGELRPSDSSVSQVSLSSMNEVSLDPSPPPTPQPQVPAKDITVNVRPLRPASAASPAPLASPSIRDSRRSSATLSHGASSVSVVHIMTALDTIASSKEGKRAGPLKESVQNARTLVLGGQLADHREIFEPLRLACETRNEKLMITSLDCIQKLVSHSFLTDNDSPQQDYVSPPASPTASTINQATSLADIVTMTITSAHTETTPDTVSLQIVKALLSLVLSTTLIVHHSSLLKAVRTVYNVFLLSQDSTNQMVAQGALSQMVNHIFARCKVPSSADSMFMERRASSTVASNGTSTLVAEPRDGILSPPDSPRPSEPKLAPSTNGHAAEESSADDNATTTEAGDDQATLRMSIADSIESVEAKRALTDRDLLIKDAYLVFRALCRLTMKSLNTESERDLKSHAMRSKLLSLHLVLSILDSHVSLFVDSASVVYSNSSADSQSLLEASKQYLLLSLSRNAVSTVHQVFEISVEIFWRILSGMRTKLKKEIEVLLNEIFLPILEMRNSTAKQKGIVMSMVYRLCQDPQALVEVYLNYDCDSEALQNIYERLMNIISKIGSAPLAPNNKAGAAAAAEAASASSPGGKNRWSNMSVSGVPPSLTTAALGASASSDAAKESPAAAGAAEARLKRQGLDCLVEVLKSLVVWGTDPVKTGAAAAAGANGTGTPSGGEPGAEASIAASQVKSRTSEDGATLLASSSTNRSMERLSSPAITEAAATTVVGSSTSSLVDDPGHFESAKLRKTTLLEGIKKFNFKPKRGIAFLIDTGFIPDRQPQSIAKFLHETDGLSKAMIGEYLGEGEDENIAIMHAFVDQLDFSGLTFTEALRMFLQSFRLPGEAQKIDRYMLKFAARYMASYTGSDFANADTVYVLAYSTILLNTDAYNPQVKNRMTKEDFIKNNRGINEGESLPQELLLEIYDDIYGDEIRMKDEIETSMLMSLPQQNAGGLAGALANVGRDLQKEAYVMQSTGMAHKTEALFKTMMRAQRKGKSTDQFYSASHFVHVRPMFEVAWMPFLAGLSGPLQDTDDLEIVELCLDGFRAAIKIVCFFDLDLERNAFVTTLAKFTFLNNLGEMKTKNMEAIKALLDIAVSEGNHLRSSWNEVLTCVSQLERMQLISSGLDLDTRRGSKQGRSKKPTEELANESRSTHITVAADMVFSLSHYLSGTAIVDFVQALSDVSWEEIKSSGMSDHPRLFSLQKLVDISYYNMNRIRIEWSNMWVILGGHFNEVCCHNNPNVAFFALDALRQLAMRFLEKEELPLFKFQKDFLKPFEHTMIKNANPDVRDMVLQCLQQMLQLRAQNMRSGWRTMFAIFSAASKVLTERVVTSAFDIVTRLNNERFPDIVTNGSFADFTVCVTDFCKVSKFQKISLLAMNMLRGIIPTMLRTPECGLIPSSPGNEHPPGTQITDDPMIKSWYPILFSFYDIIMNGEDLEVRRLALDTLFDTLKKYGSTFAPDFWDTVCQELLFPIFAVLRSSQDLSRFHTQEDMSVWLSTTMIQALRNLIDLYTFYFETLERTLDGLLDLLCVCICQENDTLARIGTSCFQQLLEHNVHKLSVARWERVITSFVRLFKTTTPHQLFDEDLRTEQSNSPSTPDNAGASDTQNGTLVPAPLSPGRDGPLANGLHPVLDRRRIFKQIIVRCVLQLLLIETTHELLQNQEVYDTIPPSQLLRLTTELDNSYQFARSFNADKDLRTGLWRVGFMKHLPNLLKQESSSAATLVNVWVRMYSDRRPEYQAAREEVLNAFVILGRNVLGDFNALTESQGKNIAAWTPVVTDILNGIKQFDDQAFALYLPAIYPLATDLLMRETGPELREALRDIFVRVGRAKRITDRT